MLKFNEDTRVKFPATAHFLRLGYDFVTINDSEIDFETKIFINLFKPAMEKINDRKFEDSEIRTLLEEINTSIKNNDLGKSFYNWLINPEEKVKLLDFDNIQNNSFSVVTELPFSPKENTERGSFRPDINILINGMPLAFLEVKKPNNEGGIQKEFDRMINQRLVNEDFRKYFNLIQLVSFSNNMEYVDDDASDVEDIKYGSFYTTPNGENTTFSFFREDYPDYHDNYPYLEVTREQIEDILLNENYDTSEIDSAEFQTNMDKFSPCNSFITSLFDKERFMYYLKYGMMYLTKTKKITNPLTGKVEEIPVRQKHIMRYPQFFASKRIVEKLENGGKQMIVWHTQGSGKTNLSAFTNKILKDYYAKQGITARFFYIVDRLDLMLQVSNEYAMRNFNVINCTSKEELGRELAKPFAKPKDNTVGDIVVVNIQKIDPETIPHVSNDYNANIQRIFFVDEAHRSYSKGTGEFYKNLMTCDDNAVYIAMTGTPLLNKETRSNLRFGDYVHKYFYDKSIADGYTLRIKKEEIETIAKSEIRANLDIENQNLDSADVYESDDFVDCVSKYIDKDFHEFRLLNNDSTIGGMIVCRSNDQAKKVQQWFEGNSNLRTGLVISDAKNPLQERINKTYQEDFRNDFVPDLLIVNYMLTTGYDVPRLKKMYLLRAPKAHSLLQTISRVNRPYKNKTSGRTYKYGYIMDFVDIEEEYNSSLQAYIKELEGDYNSDSDDKYSLSGLVVDKEDIMRRYLGYKEELSKFPIDTDDAEKFRQQIEYLNKDALLKINKLLVNIKDCRIEFELSRAEDYAMTIEKYKIKRMIKVVQDRIKLINLHTKPIDTLSIMNNKEVMEIIYEFIKVKVLILNLADFDPNCEEGRRLAEAVGKLQDEIKKNKNKNDIKIKKLEELLKEIFEKMTINNLDEITGELEKAYKEAKEINEENERLAEVYGGHFSFVKTYSDAINSYDIEKSSAEELLLTVYENVKDKLKGNAITVQGKANFISSIKKEITPVLFKKGLYVKVRGCMDDIFNNLYVNIQLYL